MENQHSHSTKSAPVKTMFEFFYEEFQNLRLKTGIRQWEQLNEQPDAAKVIHDAIEFMCQECVKPPYHVVRDEVKQRVIGRAIVEDQEFIGLNAKFVQRALAKWWTVNSDRVMEAMNEHKVEQKIELTPEQKRKIDDMANRYVAELLQGDGPKMIPKIDGRTAEMEGAEWTSALEHKATGYKDPHSPEWYALRDRIRRTASEFYKERHTLSGMQIFQVQDQDIFAESESDAIKIYQKAKEK